AKFLGKAERQIGHEFGFVERGGGLLEQQCPGCETFQPLQLRLLARFLGALPLDLLKSRAQGLDALVELLPFADAKLAVAHSPPRGVVALERLVETPRLARPRRENVVRLGVERQAQFTGFAQAGGGRKERRAGLALDTQHFMRALPQGPGRKSEGADEDV